MNKGKIISFSGIDSSGKSTYIGLLEKELKKRKIKYKVIWSRGGYTNGIEFLKTVARFVLRKRLPVSGESQQRTELFSNNKVSSLWYIIAVLDLLRLYGIVFRVFRLLGYYVICDRYFWDTYIDFSFIYRKKFNHLLWKILKFFYAKPDTSFYLFISPQESVLRSQMKNEAFSENLEKRVIRIKKYELLDKNKVWTDSVCTEHQTIDEIWDRIKIVLFQNEQ